MKILKIILTVSVLVFAFSCNINKKSKNETKKDTTEMKQEQGFILGNIVIMFKDNTDIKKAIQELEKNSKVKCEKVLEKTNVALFQVPKGKEKEFLSYFDNHSTVKYAELNQIVTTQ